MKRAEWRALGLDAEPSSAMLRVLKALDKAGSEHGSGQDWTCPAHDDRSPSLGVKQGADGLVLLSCQAGCTVEDVVESLDLSMGDLWPDEVAAHAPDYKVTDRYNYTDEKGRVLFQVVRQECRATGERCPLPSHAKHFHQRQPDEPRPSRKPKRWKPGVEGVRRVPYRLPELLAAAKAGEPLYICEGEKDADRVTADEEVCATTAPGGSDWRDEWSALLVGASEVTVIADRDAPGYRRARRTYDSLRRAGVDRLRIALPRPKHRKADYSDHADAGGGLDSLVEVEPDDLVWPDVDATAADEPPEVVRALERLRIAERARQLLAEERAAAEFAVPPSRLSLAEEFEVPDQPATYTIDDLHPTGANTILVAGYKTGKTVLSLNVMKALADGEPFLGTFQARLPGGRVAMWNYELTETQWRAWARKAKFAHPDRAAVLHLRDFRISLTSRSGEDWAVRWLEERDARYWILDPFGAAFDGDENSNAEVREWLKALDVIKRRAGVTDLLMPVHTGRAAAEEGEERARGATRLDDWADVRWLYTKQQRAGFPDSRYLRAVGRDVDCPEFAVAYDSTTHALSLREWVDRSADRREDNVRRVSEVVAANPGITAGELVKAVHGRKEERPGYVREAIGRGEVVVVKDGKASRHYVPCAEPRRTVRPKVRRRSS